MATYTYKITNRYPKKRNKKYKTYSTDNMRGKRSLKQGAVTHPFFIGKPEIGRFKPIGEDNVEKRYINVQNGIGSHFCLTCCTAD